MQRTQYWKKLTWTRVLQHQHYSHAELVEGIILIECTVASLA